MNLLEVDQRLGALEKVFEVIGESLHVCFVLGALLNVERHDLKLVKVLQPGQVVVSLDQSEHLKFFKVAEFYIVALQVKELAEVLFA